jgi:hypothetical protein
MTERCASALDRKRKNSAAGRNLTGRVHVGLKKGERKKRVLGKKF